MIEAIVGNATVEKVLLYLHRYGKGYAREIAHCFGIALNGVQQQLKRLETGGVIVSTLWGRVRMYEFNPRYPFRDELAGLLKKAFSFVSDTDRRTFYMKRTRPRRQGKPL